MDKLLNEMIEVLILEILDFLPIEEKYNNRVISKKFYKYTKEIFLYHDKFELSSKKCNLINNILIHIHDNYRIKHISMFVFRKSNIISRLSTIKDNTNTKNLSYISLAECKNN